MKIWKKKLLSVHETIFKVIYKKIYDELIVTVRRDNLLRFGNENDGGYIVDVSVEYDNLVSFGIADDISFELDFINYYPNSNLFCYDPSIDNLPGALENSKFFKIGIAKKTTKNYQTLSDILLTQNIDPAKKNFIKMDVEGFEWEVIEHNLEELILFDNFVLEIHFYELPPKLIFLFPLTLYKRLKLLRKLKKHFDIYNVHFNNGPRIINFSNFLFPECVEVSFLNKRHPKLKHLNNLNDRSKEDKQPY
jgi:hypothetical protein